MSYEALNSDQRGGVGPNGKPSLTINEAAIQLGRAGLSWSAHQDEPAVVTYACRATAPSQMPLDASGFERFTNEQTAAVGHALSRWSEMANIKFVRVGASGDGYSNDATILFGDYRSAV